MTEVDTHDSVLPANHPECSGFRAGKVGVLLINLGTPDELTVSSVRRYLREFLWDSRVVEVPRFVWFFVLYGIILPFRPKKSLEAYKKVWRTESDESPLRYFTREQALRLGAQFGNRNGRVPVVVEWAMRYGNPSIESVMKCLHDQGCHRVIVVPLYPQYSATTTASVVDQVSKVLSAMRWQPVLRFAEPYHRNSLYISALKKSFEKHCAELDFKPEVVLASFHGIPQHYFDQGDPYYCFCQVTGRLLREALGLSTDEFKVTFQSRFGPREWLKPYTDDVLVELAQQGVKNAVVITPGFAADCIETLEEIAIESKHAFLSVGGEQFSVVPCLNESVEHIDVLDDVVRQAGKGWLSD